MKNALDKRSVIVVDDSALSLEVVSAALEAGGFDVHGFTSAFDVAAHLDAVKPDVIVVDLMMPAIGGDKVIDVLRRNATHECPVILYSAAPEYELRSRAIACQASGWVRKTADLGPLVRLVHQHAYGLRASPG